MLNQREINWHIIEQAVDAVILVDMKSAIVYQNAEARRLFGYPDEELISQSVHDRLHYRYEDGRPIPLEHCKVYRAILYQEAARDFIWELFRKDGSSFFASCTVWPLFAEDRQWGAVFFVKDITDRKNAEDSARRSNEFLQMAIEVANIGLFDHDRLTGALYWNDAIRKQFGVPPDVPVSLDTFFSGLHPEDRRRIVETHERLSDPESGGQLRYDYRTIGLTDGKERWISAQGKVFYENGKAVRHIGATVDITERKMAEAKLQEAAHHDPLTGLPNRALLAEYSAHLLAMAERDEVECAVLFIDLDHFKPVNDLYGHDVGDKVLQEVARRLRISARKEDIVSRLGGDEFLVVLPHINSPIDPQTVARHIIDRIDKPIRVDGIEVSVSPSIGISSYPKHGRDIETLIRCADLAMYSAKQGGRNDFKMYIPGHDEKATQKLQLEMRIKHAVDSNSMVLLYQPIIDLESGDVVSVEALIRLVTANGNVLSPDQFIPIAEASGMIDRIGQWVAEEACRQHEAWHAAGMRGVSVAINVSALELKQSSFADHLADAIQTHGLDPSCLHVEVTESAIMSNVAEAVKALTRLRSLGIRIALDDFGTGYSSLAQLRNLPIDTLKIDQSFVHRLDTSRADQNVTDTIIDLGRSMNLQVVGEGIESQSALDYLRHRGCNQAQGFLFSRPLPADELQSWYFSRAGMLH